MAYEQFILMKEEREYVEALQKGSREAFDNLFRKYAERVYAFTLGITRQPFAAEEITQIVFLKVWEKHSGINSHFSFKSFLFSVTYHEIVSWLRKENSEKRKHAGFTSKADYSSRETEISIEFHSLESLMARIIDNFPERRRQVFKLSREKCLTNEEIASKLDISVKTVESHITSALNTLREQLSKYSLVGILFYYLFIDRI
jgi:RNA polymerase sigma-70 factor (ECF subfamily)